MLKRNNDMILIGSIAPDISKQIGESKLASHFLDSLDNENKLYDDFVLGYFIHLYTDYLWFKYFIPEVYENSYITKLDGTTVKCEGRMLNLYI